MHQVAHCLAGHCCEDAEDHEKQRDAKRRGAEQPDQPDGFFVAAPDGVIEHNGRRHKEDQRDRQQKHADAALRLRYKTQTDADNIENAPQGKQRGSFHGYFLSGCENSSAQGGIQKHFTPKTGKRQGETARLWK